MLIFLLSLLACFGGKGKLLGEERSFMRTTRLRVALTVSQHRTMVGYTVDVLLAQAYTLGVCWTLQARDPTTLPLCLETTRSETETVSGRSPVAQSCVACVFVHSVPLSVYRVCAPKSFEFMLNGQRPSRLFETLSVSSQLLTRHGWTVTLQTISPQRAFKKHLHRNFISMTFLKRLR